MSKRRLDKSFWISIEVWKYLCWQNDSGTFSVWHHVTPADSGYGQEVEVELPSDYFEQHTVEQFYEYIASCNTRCVPSVVDREKQIEDICQQLRYAKWIQ